MDEQRTSTRGAHASRGRDVLRTLVFSSLFATGAISAALLAGCGAAQTVNGASVEQRAAAVLRQLAHCVRAHGLADFPDPQVGSDGVARFPDSAPRVPVATQQACRSIAARIPPQYTSTAPASSGDYRKLLTFARCVRSHGMPDWPDPNALGEFPINARIEQGGKRLFSPALHACARLLPNPNGGIHVVRARPTQ
jgi:hypothetical protein